ncbi:MAG TPA: hypothetical protein VIJ29_00215 [Candidatus Paceibacterota bacterium]
MNAAIDRKPRQRRRSLDLEEERQMIDRGPEFVSGEMHGLLINLSQVKAMDLAVHPDFFKANSLTWIWGQMNADKIETNVYILMGRKGIHSIHELAGLCRMHPNELRQMVETGKGWNVERAFLIASILDARPELLLQADLARVVSNEVINWQI